ncbi:DUF6549 family protein [uncultured Alistipes sp.]|uniref:DUF6549 family protein n=1 Tax=uncultured Alistipes sp. TaxID=538949 RepID=UPI00266ED443|nr:DUF6549 family protein [uncultured Alistipes sp.]
MNRFLLLYALCATALLVAYVRDSRREIRRLTENQAVLGSEAAAYHTQLGEAAASAQVLRLRCAEFERLRAEDAERIRRLGIRLRRTEAAARSATQTRLALEAPLRDTVFLRDTIRDTVRTFRWHDPWVAVEGTIARDSVHCRVASTDTLHQIVHRIPRRFLFIRWGTKALRQEIVSSNPHTRIVHTEYVKIER